MFRRGFEFRFASWTLILSLALYGCATSSGQKSGDSKKTLYQVAACGLGGVGGGYLAKVLAKAEAARRGLSAAEAKKLELGYIVGLALIGCGAAAVLAGTVYAKLSERGKKNREDALLEAAKSARVQRYSDPDNKELAGTVKPGPRYAEADKNRECIDQEDTLADKSKGEAVFVKYCRSLPNGEWEHVVT